MTTSLGHKGIIFVALLFTGCASGLTWFSAGALPPELAGMWIDEEKTTSADTAIWLLGAGGDDRSVHLRVVRDAAGVVGVKRDERRHGYWYLSGALSDTTRRAICFKERPRDGGTCRAFHLDTIPGTPIRRRLTILGYAGEHHVSVRLLTERTP